MPTIQGIATKTVQQRNRRREDCDFRTVRPERSTNGNVYPDEGRSDGAPCLVRQANGTAIL
jgi:hypothetical protein